MSVLGRALVSSLAQTYLIPACHTKFKLTPTKKPELDQVASSQRPHTSQPRQTSIKLGCRIWLVYLVVAWISILSFGDKNAVVKVFCQYENVCHQVLNEGEDTSIVGNMLCHEKYGTDSLV